MFTEFWERLTKELVQSDPLDVLVKLAAALILAVAVYAMQRLARPIWRWAQQTMVPWWQCRRKIARVRTAVDEHGAGLWLAIKHNPHPPRVIDRLKNVSTLILTIANLKGGVGKTTLTANLAAYFANPFDDPGRRARNVLVIDLDFQGSCSSMLFARTAWRPNEGQLSQASELIRGRIGPDHQGQLGQPVTDIHAARGISAFYDLARIENSEMVRWLIGDEDQDIRYRLAHLLLSDTVLHHFDVIVIDAPPRLTTASVQALCASTHVLIPTILDPLSGDDPVGYFGRQLNAHSEIWPYLKVMGVVGSLTNRPQRREEEPALKAAGDRLRAALEAANGRLRHVEALGTRFEFPYECSVRRITAMARVANRGVPYVALGNNNEARAVRAMFDGFGQEVERRWHL